MAFERVEKLIREGDDLIGLISQSTGDERYRLHQDLHRVIENLRVQGGRVPGRFRSLDHELLEEEIEDQFDNLPV